MSTSATALESLPKAIQLSVSPVFLLAGIGAMMNVLSGRLGRSVDRARSLKSREHDLNESEWEEFRLIRQRMRLVIRSIELLAIGMESFAERCVDGIEANRDQIAALVDRSLMLVTALAPEIGYDNAATIAKHAHKNGQTLKEAALELELVDAETFDRLVRPEDMV